MSVKIKSRVSLKVGESEVYGVVIVKHEITTALGKSTLYDVLLANGTTVKGLKKEELTSAPVRRFEQKEV